MHARGVNYVFEDADGWIVMFDHGEFGGGIEWYFKTGGKPCTVAIGKDHGNYVPENVNRAVLSGGVLFVLQGLGHGVSTGQFAALWREHDHFTSKVIARYSSEPTDWAPQPDGTWLVLTRDGIWRTSRTASVELVTRLPQILAIRHVARPSRGRAPLRCRAKRIPPIDADLGRTPTLPLRPAAAPGFPSARMLAEVVERAEPAGKGQPLIAGAPASAEDSRHLTFVANWIAVKGQYVQAV